MAPLLPQAANTDDNSQTMDDRTPMPAGDYLIHMVKSEFKANNAKTGHYLTCQFTVLEGEHKGKNVWNLMNLDNPNAVAVEIANKELNSMCAACGKEGVEDSDELLQIPFCATLKITPGDAQYAPKNEISAYKTADEFDGDGAAYPVSESNTGL